MANSYYSLSMATTAVIDDDAGAHGPFMSTVIGSRAHDKGEQQARGAGSPPNPPCACIGVHNGNVGQVEVGWGFGRGVTRNRG